MHIWGWFLISLKTKNWRPSILSRLNILLGGVWPRSWAERPPSNKKRGHGPHLTHQTHTAQHTCCSNTYPTSKQRFICSKQQLQQFASPFCLLPFCLILFCDVEIKPCTSTRAQEKREGRKKKSEGVGGGDGGGEGLREGGRKKNVALREMCSRVWNYSL